MQSSRELLNLKAVIDLIRKYAQRDIVYMVPLVLLALWFKMRYFIFLLNSGKGFPTSADSEWYLQYARSLMTNFKIGLHMNDIMYAGYNLLLTLLLAIFKDPVIIVFIQVLTASLSVILVYKIALMLFNRTTAVIASVLYSYSWSITLWSVYILTDSFFISLLLLSVYLLLKSFESDKKIYKISFAILTVYMMLFRPAGLMTLAFVMLYFVIRPHWKTVLAFLKRHRLAIGGAAAAAIVALVYVFVGSKFDPLIASLQLNAKMVLYNVYAKGWIYDMPSPHDHFFRPDYKINILNSLILSFIINNWDHITILYAKRALAFLGRWVWTVDWTTSAGIQKFAWNVLPTVLFAIGTIAAFAKGLFRKASVLWLIIAAVFLFCIIFFIDGMYRYKAPSVPFIVIVVAYGIDRVVRGVWVIAKMITGKLPWIKQKSSL